jgi:lipase maturation factor 1
MAEERASGDAVGARPARSGPHSGTSPPGYVLARAVFLRLLGVVFLAAFLSLPVQVRGLMGEGGIVPAAGLFSLAREALGPERYWRVPSLFWLSASDGALVGACVAGVVLAVLLLLGVAPRWVLVGLWALYLSFMVIGQPFFGYQWDALLLETALLAVFLAPGGLLPGTRAPDARGARGLLRWLVIRLLVLSGVVKLLSGDPTWRDLTALRFHSWTQPLPTPLAWEAAQLPLWGHRASAAAMLAIELAVPFLLLGPRRLRHAACVLLALLQLGIAATGNYGFFNLLTLTLVLLNVDDSVWERLLPARLRERWTAPVPTPTPAPVRPREAGLGRVLLVALAGLYVLASVAVSLQMFMRVPLPGPLEAMLRLTDPFRVANPYGLFAVMTKRRDEVVLEGSRDGHTWQRYRLPYRPEDPNEPPRWAFLHMPRLDWQLWFAALGTCRDNVRLLALQQRLLQGEPRMLPLLAEVLSPPEAPPRFVRTRLESLRFTTREERARTGAWWVREPLGPYCPVLTLEDGELRVVP